MYNLNLLCSGGILQHKGISSFILSSQPHCVTGILGRRHSPGGQANNSLKTSQVAFASIRSRWHLEVSTCIAIHPCHEPHSRFDRQNPVSGAFRAVQIQNGRI